MYENYKIENLQRITENGENQRTLAETTEKRDD